VDFDSDETAFVTPCNRIEMSDEVEAVLIEKLAPLGVKWMRWWVNGHIVGRSFEEVL
jgi:hypothetical protein